MVDAVRRCGAANRQNGKTCRNARGFRTSHPGAGSCYLHGGSTPNGGKAANMELARRAVDMLAVPVVTDVFAALQDALNAANGMYLATQRLVLENTEDPKTLGAALRLYANAIDRLTLVAKTLAGIDIDERRLGLDKAQGALLNTAFRLFLTDMAAQHPEAFTAAIQKAALTVFAVRIGELSPRTGET